MKLDDILVMWEADSVINDNHLGEASTSTPKLHSKYLRLLVEAKIKKSKYDMDYNSMRKLKFRYYRGEMTRQELAEMGWEQWQYNKPLKTEMDEFLKGDDDLVKLETRIQHVDTIIFALESIMSQIKQRDFQLSNGIKWKQFLAGN